MVILHPANAFFSQMNNLTLSQVKLLSKPSRIYTDELMTAQTFFEFIGYAASILIAISLMMKSLIKLRVFNGIGALVFVVYGILIKAYPVAVLNGLIVVIDIYYLVNMMHRKDYFSLMEVTPNSRYLEFFLNFHLEDIRNFFPSFSYQPCAADLIFFVLRDTIPAGLVIIQQDEQTGKVLLDYALNDYRDFKIGAFIFDDNADLLQQRGIDRLTAKAEVPFHAKYLRRMGFVPDQNGDYQKELLSHFIQDQKF